MRGITLSQPSINLTKVNLSSLVYFQTQVLSWKAFAFEQQQNFRFESVCLYATNSDHNLGFRVGQRRGHVVVVPLLRRMYVQSRKV